MCMERLKAFLVWLIGWLRSDRMGDCRLNPQLLGYVCSRSFLQHSLFLSVFIITSLSATPRFSHACICCTKNFLPWRALFTPPNPFPSSLSSSLLLACPLLQPCSEIRGLSSAVVSHHCSLSLYGHIIFGETGRGWKKAANISVSVSLDSFFVCGCVHVCVRACVHVHVFRRESEGDRKRQPWATVTHKNSQGHFHFLKLHCLQMQAYSGGSPLTGMLLTLLYFPARWNR